MQPQNLWIPVRMNPAIHWPCNKITELCVTTQRDTELLQTPLCWALMTESFTFLSSWCQNALKTFQNLADICMNCRELSPLTNQAFC